MNEDESIKRVIDINSKEYWSEEELGAYTGYAIKTIKMRRREGEIPYYRFDGKVMFKRKEILNRWIKRARNWREHNGMAIANLRSTWMADE